MTRIRCSCFFVLGLMACTEPNPSASDGVGGASSVGDAPATTATTHAGAMGTDAEATGPTAEGPGMGSGTTAAVTTGTTGITTMSTTTWDTSGAMRGTSTDNSAGATDGSTTTGAETSTSTSTAEPRVCPTDTHVCANPVPTGWSGPSAVIPGTAASPLPSCGGSYADQSMVAFETVQASAAQCGCTCHVTSATCGDTIGLRIFGNSSCTSSIFFFTTPYTAGCHNEITSDGAYYRAWAPDFTGGSCTSVPTESISDPAFRDRFVTCDSTTDEVGDCAMSQRCLPHPPEPYDGRICIWREGLQACPDGLGYDDRSVYYQGLFDTRDCSTCSCGAISGTCPGATVQLANAECGGLLLDWVYVPADGSSCVRGPSLVQSGVVRLNNVTPTASCPPSGGAPIGDVTPTGPVTYCCQTNG